MMHPLHPLVASWVTVGSHVTASCVYLPLPQERKQEMLAIAGLLCTLWEIMGRRAERQGCAPGHVPHQHASTLSGQEAAFPVIVLCPCPCNRTNAVHRFSAGVFIFAANPH